jgi:hypothetical protein
MAGVISGPDISGLISATPTVNLPAGSKDRPRVDFRDSEFDKFIEQKGVRLAWSRAAVCPCVGSTNNQTRQPGVNCTLCTDTPGFLFFRPAGYVVDETQVGELDTLQRHLIDRTSNPAVVIKGLVQSVKRTEEAYDRVGDWAEGTISITVRKDNRAGYYDRLTAIDQFVSYSELVIASSPGSPTNLRFPATRLDFVRSADRVFEQDTDFFLSPTGQLCFVDANAPVQGTALSVTYLHHPQFIVWEHLHVMRDTYRSTKLGRAPKTPLGDLQVLPIQMLAKLEFLIGRGSQG